MKAYVITRYSTRFIFQTYDRNRSSLLVFTDKEEAEKFYRELYDLLHKLQLLEISADEYRALKGIKEKRLTSWQYSEFINTNEVIIENILELDDQFKPIKEYVKFYENFEATYSLADGCYTDINIGFHIEEVELKIDARQATTFQNTLACDII